MRHLIIIPALAVLSLISASLSITLLFMAVITRLITVPFKFTMGLVRDLNAWAMRPKATAQAGKNTEQS
jgi:hypothetical protein